MHDRLVDLREQLLKAGISPFQTRRYLRELNEHRQDLAEALRHNGLDPLAAMREADRRLGNNDILLLPMLADHRFRSPASRWPALFFFILPLGLLLLLFVASIALLAALSSTHLRAHMVDLGQGATIIWLIAPVLLGWATLWSAFCYRITMHWPALASAGAALLATALRLQVEMSALAAGDISLTIVPPALLPALALMALSLFPLLLHKAHG